jgi:hypothetical protein
MIRFGTLRRFPVSLPHLDHTHLLFWPFNNHLRQWRAAPIGDELTREFSPVWTVLIVVMTRFGTLRRFSVSFHWLPLSKVLTLQEQPSERKTCSDRRWIPKSIYYHLNVSDTRDDSIWDIAPIFCFLSTRIWKFSSIRLHIQQQFSLNGDLLRSEIHKRSL